MQTFDVDFMFFALINKSEFEGAILITRPFEVRMKERQWTDVVIIITKTHTLVVCEAYTYLF